jgi:uncharacterized protein (TIGR02266 family)
MLLCPACREELPEEAQFCGFCGFRLTPIPVEVHRRLCESYTELEVPPDILGEEDKLEPIADLPPEPALDPLPALSPEPAVEAVADTMADEALARTIAAPKEVIAGTDDEPVLLTKRKRPSQEAEPSGKPQLLVMNGIALEDTSPRLPEGRDIALEDTSPRIDIRPDLPPLPQAPPDQGPHRRAKRFPLKVEVTYGSEHNFYTGFIENLSSGGLFVATHEPVAVGESYEISFTVPGLGRTCAALCEVCWVREHNPTNPEMVPGMGLKFIRIDADARAAVELFIKHREPIFYEDGD